MAKEAKLGRFLRREAERIKQEFLEHVHPEVLTAPVAEVQEQRLNSYERQLLVWRMDLPQLVAAIEQQLPNCGVRPQTQYARPLVTYDDNVLGLLLPRLLVKLHEELSSLARNPP